MVCALDSGSSVPVRVGPGRAGSWPGILCVFMGKTLYSHGASLHPGV